MQFSLDESQQERWLEQRGFDLSEGHADGRWDLPAPATFVIDTKGIVRYAHARWHFSLRSNPKEVIGVLFRLAAEAEAAEKAERGKGDEPAQGERAPSGSPDRE